MKPANRCKKPSRSNTIRDSRAPSLSPRAEAGLWLAALNPRPAISEYLQGERNPNAKLRDDDAARVLRLYAQAIELGCRHWDACRGLAVTFRVHPRTIGKIVRGERRAHTKKEKHAYG